MSYTRRSELTATKAEAAASNVILMKDEMLTVVDTNGRRALRFGDGVKKVKDIPNSVDFFEFEQLKTQTETIKNQAQQQAVAAKADADRAKEEADRAASMDAYTKLETDVLLGGKADQPYNVLTTPANLNDSAGGLTVVEKIDGNTVQKAYVVSAIPKPQNGTPTPTAPISIAPGLVGGKYSVRTHLGLYECTIPDGYALGDYVDQFVIDPVTETAKFISKTRLRVFDGTETWTSQTVENPAQYFQYCYKTEFTDARLANESSICSHFVNKNYSYDISVGKNGEYCDSLTINNKYFCTTNHSSVGAWKDYLAAQKTASKTVQVLYQLSTPNITSITLTKVISSNAIVLPMMYMDYTPNPDVPVTPENVNQCKIISAGTNLFDVKSFANYFILNGAQDSDKMIYIDVDNRKCLKWSGVTGKSFQITFPFYGKEKTRYTIKFDSRQVNLESYHGTGLLIKYSDGSSDNVFTDITTTWHTKHFITGANKTIIGISLSYAYRYPSYFDINTMQIVEGSYTLGNMPKYEPYIGHIYDIPLPQPLRKGDRIEVVDGRYKQVVMEFYTELVGDETESWKMADGDIINPKYKHFAEIKKTQNKGKFINPGTISNYFENKSVWSYDHVGIAYEGISSSHSIRIRGPFYSIPDFTSWLSEKKLSGVPVMAEFRAAEPVYIDLPDSTQKILKSIATTPGISHVWIEGPVSPTMTAKYRLDLTAWVLNVTQAKEQNSTSSYILMVEQEQHATSAEINNIETQQAITEIMIGGK